MADNNIDDRYSAAGQSNKVTKSDTMSRFQPLTMIFANHLLVPSKTMDFVDSMNVLCSPDLNSNVSLDIHLVYQGVTCFYQITRYTCGSFMDHHQIYKAVRISLN